MKKDFYPYYISRAILSCVFALLVMGLNWMAILLATVLFGLFLLYLHSGWFRVDLDHLFFPLRRDVRGQEIQRKALIVSIITGVLIYLASPYLPGWLAYPFQEMLRSRSGS